jgi:hypothetical protein
MCADSVEKLPKATPVQMQPSNEHPDWAKLLIDAVNQPGVISAAYSRFWNYSVGNQILAMIQCLMRGIEPGPIHTFKGWSDIGRQVKKGERAITLCMPVKIKRKKSKEAPDLRSVRVGDGAERQTNAPDGVTDNADGTINMTVFTYKPHWFVLSQTSGDPYQPQELPEWSEACALHTLIIDRVPFDYPSGNCQGYASGRKVSISPIAALPHKTLFHELAHILLGHTEENATLDDHDRTPINLREVEAEAVALICCESLGLPGIAECRGYIQGWLGKEAISDRSAQRIFKAADSILKAGYRLDAETPTSVAP